MRSQIIITVEHDEDTDSIQDFVEVISKSDEYRSEEQWLQSMGFDFKVVDTEVKIDMQEWCKECGGRNGKHFLGCSVWPHNHKDKGNDQT